MHKRSLLATCLLATLSLTACMSTGTASPTEVSTIAGLQSGTPSTSSESTAFPYEWSLYNYGAIDMIRLAIQLGGNSTYPVATSSLIGAKVTQSYKGGNLTYEAIETDVSIQAEIENEKSQLTMSVGKGLSSTTAKYDTLNRVVRAKVLAESLTLDNSKAQQLLDTGLVDKLSVGDANSSILLVDPETHIIYTYAVGNKLENNKDFTTSEEFQSQIPAYQSALETNEGMLLQDTSLWGDKLLSQLEDYELTEKTYTIMYAPDDITNKSNNINEGWHLNNYNIVCNFTNRDTGKSFELHLLTLAENNIYNDPRLYSIGIRATQEEGIDEAELERISLAAFGTYTPSTTNPMDTYTKASEGLGFYHTKYTRNIPTSTITEE